MKVLLINGSPHERGCTATALAEIENTLHAEGVETERLWLGTDAINGCLGCRCCAAQGKCVQDDIVNEALKKCSEADGFIFGSPVHYASPAGNLLSFMDRLFFVGSYEGKKVFHHKPAAAVVSARRGGNTASFDALNKYFTISEMPVVGSCYWNMVHGMNADEVRQDAEGLRTMRVLAHNMAWLLRSIEAGKQAGVALPREEAPAVTNFIR